MYDYMRALQKQFEPKPEFFQNLDGDIRQIHKQLSARLEPEDRKLLLKLIDMEDLLHSEATLHSFISGSRGFHLVLVDHGINDCEKRNILLKINKSLNKPPQHLCTTHRQGALLIFD